MAVLSTALFLAAADDQSIIYKHPLDYFRAICEGLMLLLITIEAIRDIMLLFM